MSTRRALFPLLAIIAAACSSKDDAREGASPFRARFELPAGGVPAFLQVPFPSDLYRRADSTIEIDPEGLEPLVPASVGRRYIAESLARTRGFGVYAGTIFALDGGRPGLDTLRCGGDNATILYVDLDAKKSLPCDARFSDDGVYRDIGTTPVLVVRTARGVVLPEKHRIAVLLTNGVKTREGIPLAASAQFGSVTGPYREAIDAATAVTGIARTAVVSAAVYTTGAVSQELRDAREVARAAPLPVLRWGTEDVAPVAAARFTSTTPLPAGWTASLDAYFGTPNKLPSGEDDPDWSAKSNPGIAHDALRAFGVAAFDAPNLLIDAKDYGDPAHGTFFHDASGAVAIDPKKPTAKVWVSFFVPKGEMPAAGFPVVVYQHGLGSQRSEITTLANSLARRGFAVAAIDIVLQGTRAPDAARRSDTKNNSLRPTSTYDGPDGFIDRGSDGMNYPPTDLFGTLFRLAAMRDQLRQSAVDHTTLVRLLASGPVLEGLAEGSVMPKIDGSRIAFSGDSLGGIVGAMLAGIEPGHAAYVLNVPGAAFLTELAPNSPYIYPLLTSAAALHFGLAGVEVPPFHPLTQLLQHVIDGGDPIAVAGTALHPIPIGSVTPKPRNVLMFEALLDEVVPNQATEALAGAMGLPVLRPHGPLLANLTEVDGAVGASSALIQVYPAEHGTGFWWKPGQRTYAKDRPVFGDPAATVFPKLEKPIEFENPYRELQQVAFDFIAEAFAGRTPTIKWTRAPAPLE